MGSKRCTKCREIRPRSQFFQRKEAKDGLKSNCKPCVAARQKIHYQANKVDIIEKTAIWRLANLEKMRLADKVRHSSPGYKQKKQIAGVKWRSSAKGKAYMKQYSAEHFQDNKEKYYSKAKQYQVQKLTNTPQVDPLERSMIEGLYFISQVLSNSCSDNFHVDHIQPISKGGPHTFDNLQILTARENLVKGANYYG